MRYWFGAAIVIFFALFQASSVQQVHVLGVAPNVMLVLLVCWLVVRGLDDVLPMIAVAGIAMGLIGLQTPGLVLLALSPIAALGVLRELHVVHNDALLAGLIVLLASMAYELVMLAAVMLTGGVVRPLSGISDIVLPAAIVNLAITPPIYLAMRLAKPSDTRRRLSY